MPSVQDVLREVRGAKAGEKATPWMAWGAFAFVAIIALTLSGKIVETNNAGYYSVKQSAGTGKLKAYVAPGMFIQGFGDVTKYRAADTLHFDKDDLGPVEVRFNDGAKAKVAVNVRFELPRNPGKLVEIHEKFRSYEALQEETIRRVVTESVLLTAAMMSTEESYTTKRAEFSQLADDQVRNGIYITEAETTEWRDPKTGETLRRQTVAIQKDAKGQPERKHAVLDQYGILITQFMVGDIDYDEKVDAMIAAKQEAMQKTVSAKANAEKAVQDRLTAEEEGKKNVAVARYESEVEKQKAVTEAEQRLEVAKLGRLSAEQEKLALIAKGEGEGEYKRRIMQADGALEKKLDAYVKVQSAYAEALSKMQTPVVPGVVMGGNDRGGSALDFLQILGVKAARDLALETKAAK